MKRMDDADRLQASGLYQGSDPLEDVQHRSAAKKDADDKDGVLGDKGDDDASDSDKSDSDGTDKADGDSKRDADGRD